MGDQMPKSKRSGNLNLEGIVDETENFFRIKIISVSKKEVNGQIYVSKKRGCPERIEIKVKGKRKGVVSNEKGF